MVKTLIEQLGLTEAEYNTYITLLKSGRSLANQLIKKLQFHRATVYDILSRLIEKGLVSYVEINKKKYYTASDPGRFLEIINEKKKDLESNEVSVKELISNISKMSKIDRHEHIAKIYEGKEGLKAIMQDILKSKEFLVLGGEVQFKEILPVYTGIWAKERERKRIYAKILVNNNPNIPKSKWKYNIVKTVNKEYNLPNPTIIYENKVAMIMYEETPLTIVLIESKNTAQTYRTHFNMLWNLNKPIK